MSKQKMMKIVGFLGLTVAILIAFGLLKKYA
jgi:hypothetical protein